MKRVRIDKGKCIGCGTCVAIAGQSFQLGDDGKAQPIEPLGDEETAILDAVEGCPVGAIELADEKEKQLVVSPDKVENPR